MSEYTEEEITAFTETYLTMKDIENRHSLFASKLSIPRQEAKILCYMMLWDTPFIKPLLEDLETYRDQYGELDE